MTPARKRAQKAFKIVPGGSGSRLFFGGIGENPSVLFGTVFVPSPVSFDFSDPASGFISVDHWEALMISERRDDFSSFGFSGVIEKK